MDGLELVKKFSEDMETMLRRKVEAVKVPLPIPSTGLSDPLSDSTDCSWASPGWVECRPRYTNQVTAGVGIGMSPRLFPARLCRHSGMRSPELLGACRNHRGWVLMAEGAKEESRGLETEEQSRELGVGWRRRTADGDGHAPSLRAWWRPLRRPT